MSTFEFLLPDAGEGLTEAEIVEWKVQPGDTVEVNQILVEIETAKSLVELPSPFAGTVTELLAQPGQTVDVGTVIIRADGGEPDVAAPAPADDEALGAIADTASSISAEPAAPAEPAEKPGAVLVGYGI